MFVRGFAMQVRDAIARSKVVVVDVNDTIEHAARLMLERGIRHLPVLDGGRLVGVLSERDVLSFRGYGGLKAPVSMAMVREGLETARPDESLEAIGKRMAGHKLGCLPVLEGTTLVGILTATDLLAGHVGGPRVLVHPLEAPVREAMTPDPLTAHPDDRLLDVVGRMAGRGVRHLPVVDGDLRPLGMLSDRDVRRALGESAATEGESGVERRVGDYRVQDVARMPALSVDAEASLAEAAQRMVDSHVGAVAVTGNDGRLAGIVSYVDVLTRALGQLHGPSGVVAVPPEPMVPAPT